MIEHNLKKLLSYRQELRAAATHESPTKMNHAVQTDLLTFYTFSTSQYENAPFYGIYAYVQLWFFSRFKMSVKFADDFWFSTEFWNQFKVLSKLEKDTFISSLEKFSECKDFNMGIHTLHWL